MGRQFADPPHRIAARFAKTATRTGLVGSVLRGDLFGGLKAVVREGIGVGAVHKLYAATHPERTALVDTHRRMTYREVDRAIDHLGAVLVRRFGVESGTPVAIMMENRAEYVVSWFALFRRRAAGVHVSYRATADELEYQLAHSGARVVICSSANRQVAEAVADRRPDWDLVLVDVDAEEHDRQVYGWRPLLRAAARYGQAPAGPADSEGETAGGDNIVYTSGTTGQPKGAVRNFAKLGINDLFRIVERLPVRAGDRHLVVAPIYHSGGQVFTLLNAALGATIHLLPHFDPAETVEALSEWRIESVFMVPTMLRRVLNLSDEMLRTHPTPYLRCLISGAAPFPEALRRRAIQQFGARTIHDFYGATELGWVTLINGREMQARPGSVGRPIGGYDVRIVDDDGEECSSGEVGEIYVRSPHTMEGYLQDAEANDAFQSGEWVTVEDLGYLDEEGYLYLAGRARDMVITGGVNVYPVEIEDVLVDHPDVVDAGVVGVADEEWGEKLVAFVVLEEGAELDGEALADWAAQRLAGYKVPKDWRAIDELPRNPTGKIVKRELEEAYSDFAAEA